MKCPKCKKEIPDNGEQNIELAKPIVTNQVTFSIVSVYEGYKYEDTAISEIILY